MKIRKNDIVKNLSGKDRGKEAKVMGVFLKEKKVIVKGVNMVTKHKKETGNKNNPGGRIKVEAPIYVSKVMLVCPHTGKSTRIGFKIDKQTGKKVRMSQKAKKEI